MCKKGLEPSLKEGDDYRLLFEPEIQHFIRVPCYSGDNYESDDEL